MSTYELQEDNSINVPEISVSYLVTVKDEIDEIQKLIPHLLKHKRPQDEIVVLWDNNGDEKVWEYLVEYYGIIEIHKDKFQNHFADWKNKGTSFCKGDFVMQVDADEIPNECLMKNIHWLIDSNKEVDVFLVPRTNIVNGIGLSHIQKWGWMPQKISDQLEYPFIKDGFIEEKELNLYNSKDKDEYDLLKTYGFIIEENYIEYSENQIKVKFYQFRINGFDFQWRIYKNTTEIKWINQVHERLDGFKNYAYLPTSGEYDLLHVKSIEKQEKQNSYYNTLG